MASASTMRPSARRRTGTSRFLDVITTKIGLNPVLNARQRIREIEEHLCLLGFDDEKGCIQLLDYAQSTDASIQLPAFFVIVKAVLRNWSIRSLFLDILDRRGRSPDIVVSTWKKESGDYNGEWILYFNLARVCLTDTNVSEVLDSVGEAGLDDEMVTHLLIRSTEDKFQSAFVLGLLLEESKLTHSLLQVHARPSNTFRALVAVLCRPEHLGAGSACVAREAVGRLAHDLLEYAWEGVAQYGFDIEHTGVGLTVEEWDDVLSVINQVRTWKRVFHEAYGAATMDWRSLVRISVEASMGMNTGRRNEALASEYRRLVRVSPGAE
ncbi:hypothetical protein SCHPADRAFT_535547 [Schizopora paradoxa]|uniref:Uncharacterized protein n=1 Tax=Schizopora paradoxa TaxID=27342 RepID=A0A0H2RKU7_9AGAM|nr:hypothetical protein SCHPADRAFT_535547 [Schizopora paradoxa]